VSTVFPLGAGGYWNCWAATGRARRSKALLIALLWEAEDIDFSR
jgi:hypothetical protein